MRSISSILPSLSLHLALALGASSLSTSTNHSTSTIDSSPVRSTTSAEPLSPISSAGNLTASSTAPSITTSATTPTSVGTTVSPHMPSSASGPSTTSKSASTKPASDSPPATTPAANSPPPPEKPPTDSSMPTSDSSSKADSSTASAPSGTKNAAPDPTTQSSSTSHTSSSTHVTSTHPPSSPPPPTTPPKQTSNSDNASSTTPAHTASTASTTTSVVVVHAPLSGTASTITTQADTTFSTPVVLTSTAANGDKILTTPPLITIMSTSTESDGAVATLTHVVANPNFNGGSEALASADNGFFHKQALVAGVFVVVGVAIAAVIAGLIVCFRRRRRSIRRQRWLASMQQPRPPTFAADPFQDPTEIEPKHHVGALLTPERSVRSVQEEPHWDRTSPDLLLSEAQTARQYRNLLPRGPFSLYPDPYPIAKLTSHMPPPLSPQEHAQFVQAYSTDAPTPPDRSRFRHSYTPSTPSIYPATLPLEDDDHVPVEESIAKPAADVTQRESSVPVPPRPPRSHLRESAKGLSYAPPTPPTSNSSHANDSDPPSPISMSEARTQDFVTRRTFLDVSLVSR
ncbi:hypothetical protein BDN70DRAFT_200116 [Pholiota conissans]|uniref:Uncharacterized protein n=1 Tax=Pholiota conissans TaxID=109636 RepID=A0A9P5YVN9_9AGAR|nr:hypothetical protein BDN70DRAFT_200116 [Pholiota conissans]